MNVYEYEGYADSNQLSWVLPSGTELMTLPGQMETIIMTSDDFGEDKRRMSTKYAISVSSH